MTDRYELHEIADIHTDVDLQIPPSMKRGGLHDTWSLRIEASEDIATPDVPFKRSGVFRYATQGDALHIIYKTPVGEPHLVLSDLRGQPTVGFTPAFREHGDIRALAQAVYRLHLLWRGWPLVHAGAVAREERATLITAPPDHGKTSTVLSLVSNTGPPGAVKFLGDDHVFLSAGGEVQAYPRPVNLSPFTLSGPLDRETGTLARLKRWLAASRFEMLAGMAGIEMGERRLVPAEYRTDRALVDQVVVLAGGRGGLERIDAATAARALVTATLDEFDPFGHYALLLYAHAFDLPLADCITELQRVVRAAVADADCYRVRADAVGEYPDAIAGVWDV